MFDHGSSYKSIMDPKTFAKLDPKLRETYERVMGTAVPQKPTIIPSPQSSTPTPDPAGAPPTTPGAAPAATSTPAGITQPTESAHAVVAPPSTQPSTPPPLPATPMHNTIAVHTAVASPSQDEKEVKASSGVPAWKKIVFIVLGVIFFSIYAVFWLLYFKVKLPF